MRHPPIHPANISGYTVQPQSGVNVCIHKTKGMSITTMSDLPIKSPKLSSVPEYFFTFN